MSKKIVTLTVLSVFSVIVLWLFYPPTINVSDDVSWSSQTKKLEKVSILSPQVDV